MDILNVYLEPDQEELVFKLVEAARRVKDKFIVSGPTLQDRESTVFHPGLPGTRMKAFAGDFEALADQGLLLVSYSKNGNPLYTVSPKAFKYYDSKKG